MFAEQIYDAGNARRNPDPEIFAKIAAAVQAGELTVTVDLKKSCHMDCPLPLGYLKERVAYVYVVVLVAIFAMPTMLSVSFTTSLLIAGGFTLFYWLVCRPIAEARMRRFIARYVLEN